MALNRINSVWCFAFKSFRTKLMFAVCIPVILAQGLGAGIDIQNGRGELLLAAEANGRLVADQTARSLARPMWDFDEVLVEEILQSVLKVPSVQSVRLKTSTAQDIFITGEQTLETVNILHFGNTITFQTDFNLEALGQLELTFSTVEMLATVTEMAIRKLLLTVATAGLLAILLLFILGRIARPLEALRRSIQRIKDGDLRSAVSGTNITDEVGALALAVDELRQKEIELLIFRSENDEAKRQETKRIHQALQSAEDAVIVFNEKGRVTLLNENAASAFPKITLGATITNENGFGLEKHSALLAALIQQHAHEGPLKIDLNGQIQHFRMRVSPINDEVKGSLGLLFISTNMTEEVKNAEATEYLSVHDALTELGNRRKLENSFQAIETSRETPCGIMLADLDHFKQINDTFGHLIGDEVLKHIATLLKKHADENHLPVRLGGDEFAVLAIGDDAKQTLADLGEKMISELLDPLQKDDNQLRISMSLGIASLEPSYFDASELLRRADLALYKAKHGGKARLEFYDEGLDATLRRNTILSKYLDDSVERGEVFVKFQVQRDLRTGAIYGFEALARWVSLKFGEVSPAEFIPLAEKSLTIEALTMSVLQKSCAAALQMKDAGLAGSISVNFSGILFDGRALRILSETLERTNCPADLIVVEITESVLMQNSDTIRSELEGIRALGVRVAIDDFGTGYSSMGYLTLFPTDILKIDRTFLRQALQSKRSEAVLETMVRMGHALDMTVVCEGAETNADRALIQELGADVVQGFVDGRPMTLVDAVRVIEDDERKRPRLVII